MPDGRADPAPAAGSPSEVTPSEARLLRGVRINLALWSGGITLVVLLVLGTVLYVAVERSLAASGTAQLVERANQETGGRRDPGGDLPPGGLSFGGPSSGVFTLVVNVDGVPVGPGRGAVPLGLPVKESFEAAKATGRRDVRNATISMTVVGMVSGGVEPAILSPGEVRETVVTTPVRVLTEPVLFRGQSFYLQFVGDRTTEERTLRILVIVLVVGGLVALLAASGVGAAYAQRALVPIRRSLVDQREALRRQREFAADASHELRTPLTVIRASVDDLGRHASEPVGSVGSALTDIRDEVDHLTAMVDDLLLLARSDSGAVELERIAGRPRRHRIDRGGGSSRPATERGVEVVVDPAPAELTGDPARLRQLVMILLDNAIRHSPGGGTGLRARPDRRTRGHRRRRGRRAGHPERGPAAAVRPLLPCGGRARAAERASGSPSRPGSPNGTAAGSRPRTAPEGGARFTVRLPMRRQAPGTSA